MKKSFYSSLKPHNRAELDKRLIDSGFADYDDHLQWLESIGCTTSKTQLSQYGAKYKAKLEDLKIQNDYRTAYGEELNSDIETNALSLLSSAQTALLGLMMQINARVRKLTDDSSMEELTAILTLATKASTAIASLNSSQVIQKKLADELKAKLEAKLIEIGDEQRSGITQEFLDDIRTNILRI